jgi:pimeloyl-ACP methyl ester carboxylesterase
MKSEIHLSDYIEDIEINGLRGRMLLIPGKSTKAKNVNILFVHGHHSSIERLEGIAKLLYRYGNICLPDLPGFGGMDSLYTIGQKPTVDSLADYLATLIRLQYGTKKKFVLVGFSFGFPVLTRMLQKYPAIRKQVSGVISLAGFVHSDGFVFSKQRMTMYKIGATIVGRRPMSIVLREVFLRKYFIALFYTKTRNAKSKFQDVDRSTLSKLITFETMLWRTNDVRTHYFTTLQFLRLDIIRGQDVLQIPVIHIALSADQYFDNRVVEQHLKVAYSTVKTIHVKVDAHAPVIIDSAEDVDQYFPKEVRTYLEGMQ